MSESDITDMSKLTDDAFETSDFWKSHDVDYSVNMSEKYKHFVSLSRWNEFFYSIQTHRLLNLARNGSSQEFASVIETDQSAKLFSIVLDIADSNGWTPLIHASFNGHSEIVQQIMAYQEKKYQLQYGEELVDGNGSDLKWKVVFQKFLGSKVHNNGSSALHLACARGHKSVVDLFMKKMVTEHKMKHHECVNDSDFDLATPLHCAVLGKHYDICKLLLLNGSSIHQSDIRGKTAMDWAKERGLTEFVTLLQQYDHSTQCLYITHCPSMCTYFLKQQRWSRIFGMKRNVN